MLKMNLWDAKWDLDEAQCPCDIHFNQWIEANRVTGKTIYHFGTGTHHIVGLTQAANGSDNVVLGITASIVEYEAYIRLVNERPQLMKGYLAYFGDIYLTNPRFLPEFDVVTMFHLCEFFYPNTDSAEYGGLTDRTVLDLFTDKTRAGGHILFYMRSMAFHKAQPIIAEWEKQKPVDRVGEFKTLLVYRKK